MLINGEPGTPTAPKWQPGRENSIALSSGENPGLRAAPRVMHGDDAIVLAGPWEKVSAADAMKPGGPVFAALTVSKRLPHETGDPPLIRPSRSREFHVADGLAVDLVLSEPDVRQPLHLSFDARGRLWVVEQIQYPKPAGLKEISRDKVWRTIYDRVPPPPPHAAKSPFRGADKISIHEDTDADGTFDKHTVFLDGLSMATSVAHDDSLKHSGVWVLQPPYLLFFHDDNRDDKPDGPPEIHLTGFGLEDTHSIANSLRWGLDGWLYGAHGSTVSAAVLVPRRPGRHPRRIAGRRSKRT